MKVAISLTASAKRSDQKLWSKRRSIHWSTGLIIFTLFLFPVSFVSAGAGASDQKTQSSPVHLTAEQDYPRTMDVAGSPRGTYTAPEVALTFDDLPAHAALPPGLTRADIARSIIHTLQTSQAPPTYGFVNAKRLKEEPDNTQVLQLWRAAGYPLANHTFSHMDLHAHSVEAFEQDILANEATLQSFMGNQDLHWLRFPYLREGETVEKHNAIATYLKNRGYKVAEVTLSFDDYAYNDPYARCVAKNDEAAIEWMKASFLSRASEQIARGQEMSRQIYGRDIKHVMLLHIGGFETVMLPRLLGLLRDRGFKLVTLQEAESDPAYSIGPDLSSAGGGTLLQQMKIARHIPEIQHSEDPFTKLDALCR
jgi:peptidoglycan/xylan/chitin deacetylase (PgdA/CDA1 family)